MTFKIKMEIKPRPIILAALLEKPLKASELMKKTGFKRDFLYHRLDDLENDGCIETFRKRNVRGRIFKITKKGKKELAESGNENKQE